MLKDDCNRVPLDYTESQLEDHFLIVNAIAIAVQDYGGYELKQLVLNLLTFPLISKLPARNPFH